MVKNLIVLRFVATTIVGKQMQGSWRADYSKPIPQQTLILKGFRCEFDTAPHALACKELKFSSQWLGGNSTVSGIGTSDTDLTYHQNGGVTLYLDNAVVTNKENMELAVDMTQEAPLTFDYSIYGIALTGFVDLSLTFEYDIANI